MNYPHTTPGFFLVDEIITYNNQIGIFAKNAYSYTNDSPYMNDGKDGRSRRRYTVRKGTLIGDKKTFMTIASATKLHVEDCVVSPTPPADLFPAAAADKACNRAHYKALFVFGTEGKHMPKDKNKYAITADDATIARAVRQGYKTYKQLQKQGSKFNKGGEPSYSQPMRGGGKKPHAYLGDYNKAYYRSHCGDRGKKGKPCSRDPVKFRHPPASSGDRRLDEDIADNDDDSKEEDVPIEDDDEWEAEFMKAVDSLLEHEED